MPLYSKFGVPLGDVNDRYYTTQPKQKFKFRVRFLNFGGLESASYSFDSSQQTISMSRPKIKFSTKEIGTFAGDVKVFNKPKFDNVSIKFRDDMANNINLALSSQLQRQYDFVNGRYAMSSGGAKFTLVLETLDGINEIRAIDAFKLEGCFIENIDFGDFDYGSSDINDISVDISYDYIGGYYSEVYGINNAYQLMWYVTSNPSLFATNEPVANNNQTDLFSQAKNGIESGLATGINNVSNYLNR